MKITKKEKAEYNKVKMRIGKTGTTLKEYTKLMREIKKKTNEKYKNLTPFEKELNKLMRLMNFCLSFRKDYFCMTKKIKEILLIEVIRNLSITIKQSKKQKRKQKKKTRKL